MHGGVMLFRGAGAAARRHLEADRSGADEYYLEAGAARAEFCAVDGTGRVVAERSLPPAQYAGWVDWVNPITGASMGTPRRAGEARQGSPRFAEMVVNAPKSLSIAAALHSAQELRRSRTPQCRQYRGSLTRRVSTVSRSRSGYGRLGTVEARVG